MGMYDSIFWKCPACGVTNELQTKLHELPSCDTFTTAAVPLDIASAMADGDRCYGCKSRVSFKAIGLDVDGQALEFEASVDGIGLGGGM